MIITAAEPTRGYLLCSIERTGSNLLCEALTQAGAGQPREYFNPRLQQTPWMRQILGDSTLISGLSKVITAGTSINGVFGAKIHWAHVKSLAKMLGTGAPSLTPLEPRLLLSFLMKLPQLMPAQDCLAVLRECAASRPNFKLVVDLIQSQLPRLDFVWLRRENMVARAISHYRALESRAWVQSHPQSARAEEAQAPVAFNPVTIGDLHRLGMLEQEWWQWLFDELAISPYCVNYEDLVANYDATVRGTLKFLGVDDSALSLRQPALRRQADVLSERWERRYRRSSARTRHDRSDSPVELRDANLPIRGYLICSVEQTGGSLLLEAMTRAGAGRPADYFNPFLQHMLSMQRILGNSNLLSGLPKIITAGTTSNGIFGALLHWAHFRYLATVLAAGHQEVPLRYSDASEAFLNFLSQLPERTSTEQLLHRFRTRVAELGSFIAAFALFRFTIPDLRVIWLKRRNMVARAVSHFRLLHSSDQQQSSVAFDVSQVHQIHCLGLFQQELWHSLFVESGITPHEIYCEDLISDHESTVRAVIKFLDIDAGERGVTPLTGMRPPDALSEEWQRLYLSWSAALEVS